MADTASTTSIIAVAGLITGNLIGAGILGLPINTGLAGLGPSILAMAAGGALMFLSAIILGDRAVRSRNESFDYPSMYEAILGKTGKWVAVAANLIILYGLLIAYLTGGAKIIANFAGGAASPSLIMLLLAVPLVALTCINLSFLQKLNTLFILVLVSAFAILLGQGIGQIETSRLTRADWGYLPATLPIIVTAFHFHNIIPTISTSLGWDPARYRKAVFWGMALAFFMNGAWVLVGIGVIPLTGDNSILQAWQTNLPATVPMGVQLQSVLFTVCAAIFALTAICTSFLANGLGLQGFIRDILVNTFNINRRPLVIALTFLPPVIIALVYPDIFLRALDLVGGVGIVVLFGVLPALIVLLDRNHRPQMRGLCLVALLFALFILGVEIMQELGLLALHPAVEYHKIDF